MKRSGLSMAAMVATVVMVLTVSTYAITARTVNPVVGLSFQGTTAVCHAKCFAGSDNDNIQATLNSTPSSGSFVTESCFTMMRLPLGALRNSTVTTSSDLTLTV